MSTKSKQVLLNKNGSEITVLVRPIQPTDKMLEADFINNLSPESKRYRFLGGVNSVTDSEIEALCKVDEHDSMAYIATIKENGTVREIGVSRYASDGSEHKREMALTIADDYKETKLANFLIETLIEHAKKEGVEVIYSIDFRNNLEMKALAKHYSMEEHSVPGVRSEVRYVMNIG